MEKQLSHAVDTFQKIFIMNQSYQLPVNATPSSIKTGWIKLVLIDA